MLTHVCPSQHEIVTNAPAVDLLVQLAYIAAKEGGLRDELLPKGLGLEVPRAGGGPTDFDELDDLASDDFKRAGIVALINELPPIKAMREWLLGQDMSSDERIMQRTRKLVDMQQGTISKSAWRLLRFIVASNTSYLKQIEDEDELVQGVPAEYRQFRFIVGDPAKEHRLRESIKLAQQDDPNAVAYPTLYAWHGSSAKNFHSILRQGLHFKETINGRAYVPSLFGKSIESANFFPHSCSQVRTRSESCFAILRSPGVRASRIERRLTFVLRLAHPLLIGLLCAPR